MRCFSLRTIWKRWLRAFLDTCRILKKSRIVQVQMVGWSRAFWLMTWWQFFQIKLWFSRLEIVVYCDSGYLIRSYIQSWKDRFKLKLELLEGFWIFWLKDTYIFIIVRLGCFLEKFKSSPKKCLLYFLIWKKSFVWEKVWLFFFTSVGISSHKDHWLLTGLWKNDLFLVNLLAGFCVLWEIL